MRISQIPKNSYYRFAELEIFNNENDLKFIVMKGQELKVSTTFPADINVEESTKEKFKETLDETTTETAMSHLYKEIYNNNYRN